MELKNGAKYLKDRCLEIDNKYVMLTDSKKLTVEKLKINDER